jgi:hypothetical protein
MALTGTDMSDDEEPKRLVFYKEDIEKIAKTLEAFLKNAKLNCILLVDRRGIGAEISQSAPAPAGSDGQKPKPRGLPPASPGLRNRRRRAGSRDGSGLKRFERPD